MGLTDGLKSMISGKNAPAGGNFDASNLSMEECLKLIGEKADLDNVRTLTELVHEPNINQRFRNSLPQLKIFL